jgi:hypothetical protein
MNFKRIGRTRATRGVQGALGDGEVGWWWWWGFPCFFKEDTKYFRLSVKSSDAKTLEIWVRGNVFQNSYFYLLPGSLSPAERRVKLGISWQGLIINVVSRQRILPYYTGEVFFLNCQ